MWLLEVGGYLAQLLGKGYLVLYLALRILWGRKGARVKQRGKALNTEDGVKLSAAWLPACELLEGQNH